MIPLLLEFLKTNFRYQETYTVSRAGGIFVCQPHKGVPFFQERRGSWLEAAQSILRVLDLFKYSKAQSIYKHAEADAGVVTEVLFAYEDMYQNTQTVIRIQRELEAAKVFVDETLKPRPPIWHFAILVSKDKVAEIRVDRQAHMLVQLSSIYPFATFTGRVRGQDATLTKERLIELVTTPVSLEGLQSWQLNLDECP